MDKQEQEAIEFEWNNRKIIFCDVDGTLINENYQISPIAAKALKDLINNDRSFHFSLISGRCCAHELIFYKELGLKPTGLLIGSNGSQIYNLSSHKMIKEWLIDEDVAQAIYNKLMELEKKCHHIQFLVNYNVPPLGYNYNIDAKFWEKYNVGNSVKLRPEFSSKNVLLYTVLNLQECLEEFTSFLSQFHLCVIPGNNLTGISAYGVTKRNAIEYTLMAYHTQPKHVCVIGDSKNDVNMFEIPEVYSITYKDAKPYLKKIAKDVVDLPVSEFIAKGLDDFKHHLEIVDHQKN